MIHVSWKSFSRSENLNRHINTIHEGERNYKWNSYCSKYFTTSGSLRNHKDAPWRTKKLKLWCLWKIIHFIRALKKHINIFHEGQKNYKCDACEKSFTQLENLIQHVNRVHKDQKNHKCEVCEMSFSMAESLKRHINSIHDWWKL